MSICTVNYFIARMCQDSEFRNGVCVLGLMQSVLSMELNLQFLCLLSIVYMRTLVSLSMSLIKFISVLRG